MSRPSDGMELEDIREEFDWISEFQSRMAERIRGDADVHNLVDYVDKLESENERLRELGHQVVSMLGLGSRSGEGLGREWCRELHDKYAPEFVGKTDGEVVA